MLKLSFNIMARHMAKIIVVAGQKGGSGKTTIAAHLAVALNMRQYKVAIIDTDPQGSLKIWYERRQKSQGAMANNINFSATSGWRIERAARQLATNYDYIIVDSPPHNESDSRSAFRIANLVILPMQASPADLWATQKSLDIATEEGATARILVNRYNPQAKISQIILQQIKGLHFRQAIGNRVAFSMGFLEGLTVMEIAGAKASSNEVLGLTEELFKLIARQ